MFTGLIEKKGQVISNQQHESANRLAIRVDLKDIQVGASIAINGVCLTVLPFDSCAVLYFDLSPETLTLTTLGLLASDDLVNVEQAMTAHTRFGGHYVSGHVDTMAQVHSVRWIDECLHVCLGGFKQQEMLYLIPKGSITVDGVSLTINKVSEQHIHLMLIPHTLTHTTLSVLTEGQYVNIEFDYLTRIVAHQLQLLGQQNSETQ